MVAIIDNGTKYLIRLDNGKSITYNLLSEAIEYCMKHEVSFVVDYGDR